MQRLSTEERRKQLFEFAAEEIDLQRHLPVGYDRIAVRAGVTPPLIYTYFSDDREIYEGIIDLHLSFLSDMLMESDGSVEQAVDVYFEYVMKHGSALPIILSDPYMKGKLPSALQRRLAALILPYARRLQQQSKAPRREVLLALLTYLAIPEDLARQCKDGELEVEAARHIARDLAQRGEEAL